MTKSNVVVLAVVLCAGGVDADDARPRAQTGSSTKRAAAGKVVQRFLMNPYHVNIGTIGTVKADGTVTIREIANPRFILKHRVTGKTDLTEGRYLGFVGKDFVESTKDIRLITLQVTEVRPKGGAVVRVVPAAARKIKPGEDILFFRPPGSTTAQLKSAPGFVRVDDGEKTTLLGRPSVNVYRSLTKSKNNLKQIGLAMHNFHEVYNHFPPAVVYGPDGKRWHSWRVLILPFIEEASVYKRYRFDEPWNGPNNKKLLKEMPAVFRDPIHGEEDGNYYTHYAVITGKGTIFPTTGAKMKKKSDKVHEISAGSKRIRDIVDGTSNTIMTGTIGPKHKIPWMKPQDVVYTDKFPALGKKGSFAAPYKTAKTPFGVFLFGDGRVSTILADVELQNFRNLLRMNDGNPIGEFPTADRPRRGRPGARQMQVVEIIRTATGLSARLVSRSRE